jgi:hypothetical protein
LLLINEALLKKEEEEEEKEKEENEEDAKNKSQKEENEEEEQVDNEEDPYVSKELANIIVTGTVSIVLMPKAKTIITDNTIAMAADYGLFEQDDDEIEVTHEEESKSGMGTEKMGLKRYDTILHSVIGRENTVRGGKSK